jgi:hypothetical protein
MPLSARLPRSSTINIPETRLWVASPIATVPGSAAASIALENPELFNWGFLGTWHLDI